MLRSSISDNHHLLTHSTSIARNDPSLLLLSPQPLMSKRNRINDSDFENSKEISKNSFSKRLALVFEKQRKLSSVRIAPYSPSPKPSSSFEKDDLLFSPSSPPSPPKKPQRKYGGDDDDNVDVDASHHSISSMTSTGSVSSVSLLKNSIMPWKKNQEGRKTRNGRKRNKKEKSNEMPSEAAAVVTFNKKIKIRKICRIADMPQDEFKNYYYSNQEMLEIRKKLRVKIRVIKEEQQKREDRKNFLVTPSSTRCNDKISNDDSVQEFFGEDDGNYDESSGSESSDDDDDDDEIEICCAAYHDKTCDCHCINERNGFDDVNDDEELVTCLRGLEHEFPTGKQRRRKNKAIARDIVFEEQRYWRERKENGLDERRLIEDPALAIAEAYRTETVLAVQHARHAGISDENIAKRIYDKEDIIIVNDDDDDDGLLKYINKRDSIGTDATCISLYSSSSRSASACTTSWYTERNNDDNNITNKHKVVVVNLILPDEQ